MYKLDCMYIIMQILKRYVKNELWQTHQQQKHVFTNVNTCCFNLKVTSGFSFSLFARLLPTAYEFFPFQEILLLRHIRTSRVRPDHHQREQLPEISVLRARWAQRHSGGKWVIKRNLLRKVKPKLR